MTALANIYLSSPANKVVQTGPGRSIIFRGGQGRIVDEVDMIHALRIDGATIVPTADRCDWIPTWLEKCGEFQRPVATIELPDGEKLYPPNYEPESRQLAPPIDHGAAPDEISVSQYNEPEPAPALRDAFHTSVGTTPQRLDAQSWPDSARRGPGRPPLRR